MGNVIQSAGGIVYYVDTTFQPRYLLLKRQTKTKKIERIAPKGKIRSGETPEQAAIREIAEETGISDRELIVEKELGVIQVRGSLQNKGTIDKDTTYFLVRYIGDPLAVKVIDGEGYVGMYKRAKIEEIAQLVCYLEMRELIFNAHAFLQSHMKKSLIKERFLQLIDKD